MKRIYAIDLLKLLLAAAVVWAHAVLFSQDITTFDYILLQGVFRTVVPTFALVSGFAFHATWRNGKARIWLRQLGVLYLIWLAIYAPFWLREVHSTADLLRTIVFGPMHLWYIAALFAAVAMLAGILWLGGGERRVRNRLLIVAALSATIGYTMAYISILTPYRLPLDLYRNGPFLLFPFAALGYLAAMRIQRLGRDWLPSAPVLWLIVAGIVVLREIEAALYLRWYGLDIVAPPEFPILAFALPLAIFFAFARLDLPKTRIHYGALSMMIYFMHYLVILVFQHVGITSDWLLFAGGVLIPAAFSFFLVRLPGLGRWLYRPSAHNAPHRPHTGA